ncbi:hypothetical protein WJX81_006939 [Elliptochloris bilobata]|uniref:alpha-1,2-Mannosidase n=1 Tax=Elliptochloris bilobata TaxID=381761 RepID=A0AAW1S4R1_9CHLO
MSGRASLATSAALTPTPTGAPQKALRHPCEDYKARTTGCNQLRQLSGVAAETLAVRCGGGALRHAWSGYEAHAMGFDELRPLSGVGADTLGGMGAIVVDSLDTLWMLGLKEEFGRTRDWVTSKLTFDRGNASFFKTSIRILGGLLSAYQHSGDRVFPEKAEELGDILATANSSPQGISYRTVNMRSRLPSVGKDEYGILAEFGSQQLELITLSDMTGRPEFAAKAEAVIQELHQRG